MILEKLRGETTGSPWVVPGRNKGHRVTIQKAAKRLAVCSGVAFCPHDLSRTAASHMTGMGTSRLTVSKILNHAERGVTAVYDRHSYDVEKREALDRWEARLIRIAGVTPLVRSGSDDAAECPAATLH